MAEHNARIEREVRRLNRVLAAWRRMDRGGAQRPVIEAGEAAIEAELRQVSRQRRAA